MRANTRDRSESGASAVEYGLLVAGIAALIVIVAFAMGGMVGELFHGTCDDMNTTNVAHGGNAATC